MPAKQLKEFLDSHNTHSIAYTAQEIASLARVHGDEFAKTVKVMAILPASCHIDLAILKAAAKGKKIALASETEFRDRFPESETGAMPPFGQLYRMPVFLDERLARDKEITFNAGTHHELIRLSYEDFARLVQPKVARFSTAAGTALWL